MLLDPPQNDGGQANLTRAWIEKTFLEKLTGSNFHGLNFEKQKLRR